MTFDSRSAVARRVPVKGAPALAAGDGAFGLDGNLLAALLHAAARAGESVTYSEALAALGHRFSRPKMRALCVLLTDIDAAERGAGRPGLAVLVVRQSDRLLGQGWWLGLSDYKGLFTGPDAAAHVARRQREVFEFWAGRSSMTGKGAVKLLSRDTLATLAEGFGLSRE